MGVNMGWMKVLYPNGTELAIRRSKEPEPKELRTFLNGGYVEVVWVLHNGKRAQLVVDEEGHLKNLPFNSNATAIYRATAEYMAKQYKEQGVPITIVPKEAVILGVAILALMAWRIWREVNKDGTQ